jgi:hypothetical protein
MQGGKMKLSEYFYGLGDAVAGSGSDRELTTTECHDLHAQAEGLEDNESSAEVFLGGQGAQMDGWTLPIGACVRAMITWVKGWF